MEQTQPDSAVRDLSHAVENLLDYLYQESMPSVMSFTAAALSEEAAREVAEAVRLSPKLPIQIKHDIRGWLAAALQDPELRTRIAAGVWTTAARSLVTASLPPVGMAASEVRFSFTANRSFHNYRGHPITIPRRVVHELLANALVGQEGEIVAPDGSVSRGHIYQSATRGNGYYQLIARGGHPNDALSRIPLGQRLSVVMTRHGQRIRVHLLNQ